MRRVLVVDDCVNTLSLMSNELSRAGFDVRSFRDGHEGLNQLRTEAVDVVVADLNMASLSGLEMLAELKAGRDTCNIPVIIVTGDSDEETRRTGLDEGAAAWLFKPFRLEELSKAVSALV
jgi:DNA-binding response OmpR family regulator